MSSPVSFQDYLNENGTLTYSNVGTSMMPLLRQGIDLFTVKKKNDELCKIGDVVLFHRDPDKFVLHRIIEVSGNGYVTMGDNTVSKEYGVRDEDILGVMTSFVRSGRYHSTDELWYRLYTDIILKTIGIRVFLKKTVMSVRSIIKKG